MKQDWVVWLSAVLLFLSGVVAAMLGYGAEVPRGFFGWIGMQSGLAAWVQALGSILAVMGAAAFPYMHARRMNEQTRARRLNSLHLVLTDLSFETQIISDVFSGVSGCTDPGLRAFGDAHKRYLETGLRDKYDLGLVIHTHIEKQRKNFNDGHKAAYLEQRHSMLVSLALEGVFTKEENRQLFKAIDACRDAIQLLKLGAIQITSDLDKWGRLALNCHRTCREAAELFKNSKAN